MSMRVGDRMWRSTPPDPRNRRLRAPSLRKNRRRADEVDSPPVRFTSVLPVAPLAREPVMRVTRKIVIAIVIAAAAGSGLAGCATAIPGSPVINSAAAQVVYQQQSEDLLVTTIGLHFHYINGQQ